jgi:uncharacterized protein (DUF488 family)
MGERTAGTIWTLGHSTHELPVLLDLLRGPGIGVVADIRSQPFSRWNPQFNRERLRAALADAGLRYVFLGAELGGRPPEAEFYDGAGQVLYGAVARTERFNSGLERLLDGAGEYRVAMLCSEENPARCHRRLLVGRVFVGRGVEIVHIRGDGSVVTDQQLGPYPPDVSQDSLFG